jgi:hypothetical protein
VNPLEGPQLATLRELARSDPEARRLRAETGDMYEGRDPIPSLAQWKGGLPAGVLECWPDDADLAAPGARQYAGWPYRLSFDNVRGE